MSKRSHLLYMGFNQHTSAYACIHSASTTSGLVGLGVLYRITCLCTLHSSLKITLTLSTPRRPAGLHYNDMQSYVTTLLALLNKVFFARQCEFDPSCTLVMGECRRFRMTSLPILLKIILQISSSMLAT